ncbi:MAG: hypothetical protein M3Z14_02505 [Candidatus Eremiobacteraeota bacterium]|nr:hypothetical protein [Candidatus Eremiobacteraeota bacterium]
MIVVPSSAVETMGLGTITGLSALAGAKTNAPERDSEQVTAYIYAKHRGHAPQEALLARERRAHAPYPRV